MAGHQRAWRPMGAGAVEGWLGTQPWESSARPLVVRVPPAEVFDLPMALRRELRAMGFEAGWPCVDVVEASYCGAQVLAGLASWMGIQLVSRRQLAEAFGRLAAHEPRLVVVELGAGAPVAAWAEEVERLTDLLGKLENAAKVAFVVAVPGDELPVGGQRLDVGWPVDAVSCHDRHDRWLGYVHERVAWHTAGRIDLAHELGSMLAGLRSEDDPGLEDRLDEHARRCVARLPHVLVDRLRRSVSPAYGSLDTQMPGGLGGADARGRRVAPWLARGLLLTEPHHPARRQMRAALVCRPLASRLLSRCMDLEQQVVEAAEPRIVGYQPSIDAQNMCLRLSHSPQAVEHRLTPRGVRDIDGPLDLASLGEVLTFVGCADLAKDAAHELRRVRNALAHGSPVGWEALAILDDLEDQLR